MSSRIMTSPEKLFTAKAADGVSAQKMVSDYRNIFLAVHGAAATLTVKFRGSYEANPDLSAASSATNKWDYIGFVNLNNKATAVAGDTGLAFTGASTSTENLELNINGMRWVAAEVTGHSAGAVTVDMICTSNQ